MNTYQAEIFVANRQGKQRHYRIVKAVSYDDALTKTAAYCEKTWPSSHNEWNSVIHPTIGDE